MIYTWYKMTGLQAQDERGARTLANFHITVNAVTTQEHVMFSVENTSGKTTNSVLPLQDLERPINVKRKLLSMGNYHWMGSGVDLQEYLQYALRQHHRLSKRAVGV